MFLDPFLQWFSEKGGNLEGREFCFKKGSYFSELNCQMVDWLDLEILFYQYGIILKVLSQFHYLDYLVLLNHN